MTMDCYDASMAFDHKRSNSETGLVPHGAPSTVSVLTEDRHLLGQINEALSQSHVKVEPLDTIDGALDHVRNSEQTVTIVHLHRSDIWPGIAFHLFDGVAAGRPIIILCDSSEEARLYLKHSERVIDILPVQAVLDDRFPSIIDAATLRASSLAADHRFEEEPSAA
jgi:hypothetical protein